MTKGSPFSKPEGLDRETLLVREDGDSSLPPPVQCPGDFLKHSHVLQKAKLPAGTTTNEH